MEKKEIISRIKTIELEQRLRYKYNALSRYNTGEKIHVKQLLFHKNQSSNRWVFGGNRSGKTECGAVETVWLARGIHPYRKNKKDISCWVVSLSTQVQRDVAQKKVLYYLNPNWIKDIKMLSGHKGSPENGVIDYILISNIFGGTSRIAFKSCDQGREKFQGTSLDFIWFDEEPPYDIYLECRMRVMDRKGHIFGTMTPLKGLSWVYFEIYLNSSPLVWHEHIQWEDNPFLEKSEIEALSSSLSNDELESRKFGNFVANGGMVYPEFNENIHVIEPFDVPKEWFENISIDPGLNNPLACHWYAMDYDGNIYVIAEHFDSGKDCLYHTNKIKEISERLGWKKTSNNMLSALIDSAASQRTLASEKSVVELFYDYGILCSTNVNKNLYSGINRVKSYLKNADGKSKLFIFKNCVNMIREFKTYWWGDGEQPIKKDDHCLDELRYFIMSRPLPPFVRYEKSEIQKDKERLIKKLSFQQKKYYK